MFKWSCLAVATGFLVAIVWILNDIRVQVRGSTERVRTAADTINADLPAVVERVDNGSRVVGDSLPDLVERIGRTSEVVAELAEDIRQLKELAGVASTVRDKNLVAYADGLLRAVEASGASVGTKKTFGKGLKNPRPAAEWVAGARKEALVLTLLMKSKKEMLTRLAKTKLGTNWMIEVHGKEPVPLADWLRENYPESKDIG